MVLAASATATSSPRCSAPGCCSSSCSARCSAAVVAANIFVAFRTRPAFRSLPSEANLERYRDAVEPMRKWVVIAVGVLLGLIAGGSASGQWRTFLLWRHGQSFGQEDPYFKKDIGFFVFDLPWLHYVVNFMLMTLVLAFVAAVVVHYLFGGISPAEQGRQGLRRRAGAAVGAARAVRAVQGRRLLARPLRPHHRAGPAVHRRQLHRLQRGAAVEEHPHVHRADLRAAVLRQHLPAHLAAARRWVSGSSSCPRSCWAPCGRGSCGSSRSGPRSRTRSRTFLAKNIDATRDAYGIADVQEQPYNATVSVTKAQLKESADSLPGIRLIDPARMSQAFEQLQQVRGYYSVAPVLDVDNYPIPGSDGKPVERDLVLGVRELDQSGLVSSQRNWANEHTVYTHGYGIVAAFGNDLDADQRQPSTDEPPWAEEDLPPQGRAHRPLRQGRLRGSHLLRREEPVVLHRRQARRRQQRRARHPRGGLGGARHHDVRRQGRGRRRQPVQQAALRHQVRRAEHHAVEPGQRELEDPLRAAPARPGREGGALAHRRRRPLPRRRRRPGRVDPRRLHDDGPLPELRARVVPRHDQRRADARRRPTSRCRPTRSTTCATRSRPWSTPTTAP